MMGLKLIHVVNRGYMCRLVTLGGGGGMHLLVGHSN